MNEHLVKWNTSRVIDEKLHTLDFMRGYKGIHPDVYEMYAEIVAYHKSNHVNLHQNYNGAYGLDKEVVGGWITHLDGLLDFQRYIVESTEENKDAEIARRAKDLFSDSGVADIQFVDLYMLDKFNMLLEYAEPIKTLLNSMEILTEENNHRRPVMTSELETEIREVLEHKGLGAFKIPEHLLNNTNEIIELS